jgi:hypothetical protein
MTPTDKREAIVRLAEGVLGWRKVHTWTEVYGTPNTFQVRPSGVYHAPGIATIPFEPFTSIADAMMLAEALRSQEWWFELGSIDDRYWSASFTGGGGYLRHRAEAPTAPEAIALAAIAVIERDCISENQAPKD